MPTGSLTRRVIRITGALSPRGDSQFRAFARAVIIFGGETPSDTAVMTLTAWLAGPAPRALR